MKLQARKENVAEQQAGDETMIYDLSADKAYLLNETSAFVWQMCNGENDLYSISRALAEKKKQPVNEEIVKLSIDQLSELGLMNEETPKYFSKTSRRKAIKQIGLATLVALPIVFALTVPTAANASSLAGCFPIGICYSSQDRATCPPGCTNPQTLALFYGEGCINPAYDLPVNCPGATGVFPGGYSFRRTS